MQITSDTDFQKPSFHLKNSVIALRNLIEKNHVHLIYIQLISFRPLCLPLLFLCFSLPQGLIY